MRTSPVSFRSLMVGKLPSRNTLPVPQLIEAAFKNNEDLRDKYKYESKDIRKYNEIVDGTVHDASRNFAYFLNNKYALELQRNPKKVILTEADFNVLNRDNTEKKYFLTAASNSDEKFIHKILSNSEQFLSIRFSPPNN